MAEMDFPLNPTVGQRYTNTIGATYIWNGEAWEIGFYDTATQTFTVVGDLVSQIRTLLQDTDNSSGQYRYSSESIVQNINMCMLEMKRLRPDIFLPLGFVAPVFNSNQLNDPIQIDDQYIPSVIYYAVGMTQIRDDEGTQDTRASAFLTKFTGTLMTVTT